MMRWNMIFLSVILNIRSLLLMQGYCQTDADRNRYDTQQLIDNMLQADYISDEEILRNRGELQPEVTGEISNRSKRRIRKNKIA